MDMFSVLSEHWVAETAPQCNERGEMSWLALTPGGVSLVWSRGRIPFFTSPVLLLMKPRTQLILTLPAHVELLVQQHTLQVTLVRAAPSPFSSVYAWVAPTHIYRTLHLALLNFIRVTQAHVKPLQAPLDGIPSLQSVSSTTQLGVCGKLAEGALGPPVLDTDKDVKQVPIPTSEEVVTPLGHWTVYCSSSSATLQSVHIHQVTHLSNLCLQCKDKDVVWNSVKSLA